MKLAEKKDLPALIALWELCFGDPPAVIQSFFDRLWDDIQVFTTDNCTAMLTAMPVRWQGKPAAYLYAVATHPNHRGQGLCRNLMTFAEQTLLEQGCSYTTLHPAEDSLYRFYRQLGYETTFYCRCDTFHVKRPLNVITVKPTDYAALRKTFCENSVEYPDCLLALQAHYGALVQIGNIGCAALERTDSGWTVRELLASAPELAAQALCAYLDTNTLSVRMPGSEPFAMAKSLDGSSLIPSWLGLAFE